ncbi:50S ribosomal protein L2, chloroplastic [Apostasia shenzhenica]|uniref:50S ribosomal protein L2, chloroplastic n=1 Tax=Apostasia shenzhenica TaxID=1088818 RepID=A0A2I0A8G7_9ASPA|nr:50S ribosomal protein L2, chloroplastic [Apostasia shenzhenica]
MHLYKTSTLSTRNGAVDSQVKSNAQNNLIYAQHHCDKDRNARGIITAGLISVYIVKSSFDRMKKK